MAYRGPTLITEPEIRWPVIVVAAAITSVIVLATAAIISLAATRPYQGSVSGQRLGDAIRQEAADFEQLGGHLLVEQLVATEAPRPLLNDVAVEVTGTVRNTSGRTVTGLELRGAILDAQSEPLRARTVVVVPTKQTALEPGETISVSIMLEGVHSEAERTAPLIEVTAVRFD